MPELSNERIGKILHEETPNDESLKTILRGIYIRYVRLYEKYFADIDALNGQEIARLRKEHEETRNLIKVYSLDIPYNVCKELREFDENYTDKLLGPDWHKFLFENFATFKEESDIKNKNKDLLKAAFSKQALAAFSETMEGIFRESFGTNDKTAEKTRNFLMGLLFGKSGKEDKDDD